MMRKGKFEVMRAPTYAFIKILTDSQKKTEIQMDPPNKRLRIAKVRDAPIWKNKAIFTNEFAKSIMKPREHVANNAAIVPVIEQKYKIFPKSMPAPLLSLLPA
jgi:hypothetical protein